MSTQHETITWIDAPIEGCEIKTLPQFSDERGWLSELFRIDELPEELHPVMAYISMTYPGIARGPHEHREQTDMFIFFQGDFRVYLWDARPHSPTYRHRQIIDIHAGAPVRVIIPPGVVHGYKNTGTTPALLINCPNKLYAGWNKQEPVDEIRHEEDEHSPYVLS